MLLKLRNVLNNYEIECEFKCSDTELDNYDSDSFPEFLITDKELSTQTSNRNYEANITNYFYFDLLEL